jgi:hypothetical protein
MDSDDRAVFSVPVVGGRFVASWPRSISSRDLRAIPQMLNMTFEWWQKEVQSKGAADLEYASWFKEQSA